MKYIKKLLILFALVFSFTFANAQTLAYKAEAFCAKEYTYRGWTDWSRWQPCDILITIDLSNDIVTILSERSQYYRIVTDAENYRERNAAIAEFGFIDQDGDKGILRLVQKRNGASEIYIQFSNVAWGYTVRLL